jgi:hypothetical protein
VSGGPIDRHLRELRGRVPGGPLRRRRILGELRAHLEDAAQEEQRSGRTHEQAEQIAVERFGMPFEERAPRRAAWIAAPVVACVIVAAVAAVLSQGGGAGRPQARGPVIPYSSVPWCGTQTSKQIRPGVKVCRPRPAVGTIGVPATPVSALPAGATPGSDPGSAS